MEENTEILPVKKDADLGSSYEEYMRQFQISEDEALINEAFMVEEDVGEQPDAMPFLGDIDTSSDFEENKPEEGDLNALGIAQQILVGGPLDAVVNTGKLVTDTGESVRNFEIGGATVEQHLQALDQALGTGELFSGKVELPIASLEQTGGAGVQLGRGLMSWLTGFAMTRGAGAGNITSGIAADGLAIERDANLSNMFNEAFPEGHPLRNPLTDALAVAADDTELEKSVKSILEGVGLALPFTAVQAISKSLFQFKTARAKAKKAIKDSGGETVSFAAPDAKPFADKKVEKFRQKIFKKIPEIARKNPLEMTNEELKLAIKEMKKLEAEVDDFVLGKKDASGKRAKKQDDLFEEEDLLYGWAGSPVPVAEQFENVLRAREELDFDSAEALGKSLKYDITNLPDENFVFDPNKSFFDVGEGFAYIKLKYAFDEATRLGFDLNVVSKNAIKGAAARFPDPDDALFMLQRFLKQSPKLPGKPTFDISGSKPKVETPKVSATFDGNEYNITDMELRFDQVNSQKQIDKAQAKFDAIVAKIKKNPAKGKNKKGRDVRTLAETELQARKELQADPEGQLKELMEKDPTVALTDKDRIKWGLLEEASVRKLLELRDAFRKGDSTAMQKAFEQGKFTVHMFEQGARFSETVSRDLGSSRVLAQLKRTEGNIVVDKMKAVRKDIDPNITPESFMRKLNGVEGATDSAIEKMLSKWTGETVRLGGFDMFLEAWINSLFGFKTQVVNALGSTINTGFQVAETQIASGIRGVKRQFCDPNSSGVEQGEAFDMLYGIIASAPDNVRAFTKNVGRIFTGKEVNVSRFNKLDDQGIRAIRGENVPRLQEMKDEGSVVGNVLYKGVDITGHALTATGKGLLTVDEVFKFAAYNAAKRQYARRTAVQEGLKGDALEMRIRQLVNEPSETIKAKAKDFARLATFTQEAGETGQAIQALLKSAPAAKLIVPFFNVLNNIAKFTGSRTPLALFSKNIRADLAAGGARADMAQARLASGTMASLGFLSLAMGGGMVGGEPTNPAHRESFRRKNKQPYSLEFRHEDGTKTSVSINRLEPVAFFAGIMADFVKISGELEEGEIDNFVGAYTLAVSKHFLSQTFATGVSDFMNMAMEGDYKFIKNLGASTLPYNGIMADIEKTVDPALRDTKTFDRTIMEETFVKQYGENEGKALANSLSELTQVLARLKSRVPEFSKDLPPRLDAFGEVITTEYGFDNPVINTLNPFAISKIEKNSLEDWITQLDANIVTPKPQMEGVKLTPEEYHDWKQIAGPIAKKEMIKRIKSPEWKTLPNGVKRGLLEGELEKAYAMTQIKMLDRYSEIGKKYLPLIKSVENQRDSDKEKDLKENLSVTLTPMDF